MKKSLNVFKMFVLCMAVIITVLTCGIPVSAYTEPTYTDPYYNLRYSIVTDVKTPNGTTVTALKYIDELNESQIKSMTDYQEAYYPDVYVIRQPTTFYNCHSYAWYDSYPSNNRWINDPSPYINDGSATFITSTKNISVIPSSVTNSTKAVWVKADGTYEHSGVVWTSDRLMSKWGRMGLYAHRQDYTPYDSTTIRYYRCSSG